MTGSSPKLSLYSILIGPGACGTTSIRFGSCLNAASRFMRDMPSTMLIKLVSPVAVVGSERTVSGAGPLGVDTDAVRLWPGLGFDGCISSDAVRLRTAPAFARPSAACVAGDIRGGALAALIADCFDIDESRDSDGDPTGGGPAFLNRPEDGPASPGILNEPPIPSMSGGLDTVRFRARVALLTDSLTVSLAYPLSASGAIRDGLGACTEPRLVRFLSLATSASSSAFLAGDGEPARTRYACEGASSSELSRCTAAMF
ncbi:hypothetical protein GSI_03477 [Ganoderma sinense ZZ0214-1]|uniref:Uncharacterized protein n=1 Tax=Ganoderma sinense ZZ0214-1 TaxID=1077348 RepID=A0A2G8SLP5_9APHY|nr:hypothetical protein GSI_03477 [Ganoderma sinense ZZ0214-1]